MSETSGKGTTVWLPSPEGGIYSSMETDTFFDDCPGELGKAKHDLIQSENKFD